MEPVVEVLIDGVPAMVEPVQPPMLVVGAGMPINGLTPALLSSVDPSGMVPESALGPTEDGGRAVPPAEPTAVDTQPVVMPDAPTPLSPPPSKLELEPLAMPEDEEPEVQVGETAGLMPPGLISVAPRPIPALDPLIAGEPAEMPIPYDPVVLLAPGIPSGDTAPNAGATGAVAMLCAAATPQLNKSATAAADNLRIEISCPLPHGQRRSCDRSAVLISIETGRAIKLELRTLNLISRTDYARLLLREIALACVELRGTPRELSCSPYRQMS